MLRAEISTASTCRSCGCALPEAARFCPECGDPLGEERWTPVRRFGALQAPAFLERLRSRGRAALETLAVRTQAHQDLLAVRHEHQRLLDERERRLRTLGEAVYADDEEGTAAERAALRRLDGSLAAKEVEMIEIVERAERQLGEAKLETQSTVMLEPPAPPDAPEPYPPSIPEPYPPPDEGTPPTPEPVPEPYPPPDEGDPPRPL